MANVTLMEAAPQTFVTVDLNKILVSYQEWVPLRVFNNIERKITLFVIFIYLFVLF